MPSTKDQGKDVAPLIELNEVIFGRTEGAVVDEAAFRQATGLTPPQVSDLLQAKLLMPPEDGSFNQDDIVDKQ